MSDEKWEVGASSSAPVRSSVVLCCNGNLVAIVYGSTYEEALRRGRLIAAAPEMLEQLKEAVCHRHSFWENDAMDILARIEGDET